MFTTAVMGDADHIPMVTTATTSFDGTSVSVFQHPTKEGSGEKHQQLRIRPERVSRTVPSRYQTSWQMSRELFFFFLGSSWGQNKMSIYFLDPKKPRFRPKKHVFIFICS